MAGITGPKRYVPEWPKVHVPDWAETFLDAQTGPHDKPLRNGLSGSFDVEIEAITPLFVGARQEDVAGGAQGKRKHWLELNGKRAIPGTTVRGAIRSVVEIITFGRFAERIDEHRLSIRDLQNPTDYISRMTDGWEPRSRAGWLVPARGGWTLAPCAWYLARQTDLEAYWKARNGGRDIRLGSRGSARRKYEAWGWDDLEVDFSGDARPTPDGSFAKGRMVRRVHALGGNARSKGKLVFTGQPQDRAGKGTKQADFVFGPGGEPIDVPDDVRRDFEFIHREENGEPNEEWGMWKDRFARLREPVPVFYLEDDFGGLKAMGLAMMFRLPYDMTLREAARQVPDRKVAGQDRIWDVADILFGRVMGERSETAEALNLRGRITFGHFLQSDATDLLPEQEYVLLAPKYGFYPANITQLQANPQMPNHVKWGPVPGYKQDKPQYTTLQDPAARLRGVARFAASRGHNPRALEPLEVRGKKNMKVVTRLRPVDKGGKFRGTVRFFNLDPRELGAIVWALHWGEALEPSEDHAHMLGAAKATGMGACRMTIEPASLKIAKTADESAAAQQDGYRIVTDAEAQAAVKDALEAFTAYMSDKVREWSNSPQVQELKTLASLSHGDRMRESGQLKPMRDPKDFRDAKSKGLLLTLASGRQTVPAPPSGGQTQAGRQSASDLSAGWSKGTRVKYGGEDWFVYANAPADAYDIFIVHDEVYAEIKRANMSIEEIKSKFDSADWDIVSHRDIKPT